MTTTKCICPIDTDGDVIAIDPRCTAQHRIPVLMTAAAARLLAEYRASMKDPKTAIVPSNLLEELAK